MVGRLWRGRTTGANADAYEALLRHEVLPSIGRITGHRGAYVLRRDEGGDVEFVVLNLFDSLDAVRAFAGDDPSHAVISPEAGRLLKEYDPRAEHFDVVVAEPVPDAAERS